MSRLSARSPLAFRFAPALAAVTLAFAPQAGAQTVTWTQLSPATHFPLRAAMATAYDPVSRSVIAFGGYDAAGHSSETWAYDGTDWTQLSPANSPTARAAASMTFDVVAQKLVLFGGFDGNNYLGDTWTFDGTTSDWTQESPSTAPAAVTGPMVFTDPLNGHATVYGGFDGKFYSGSTWQWDGTDWNNLTTPIGPPARSSSIVALDPLHKHVVLFGGLGSVNPDNTWLWDGTGWQRARTTRSPVLRYYSSAAFEPSLGGVVAFGGGSGGVDQNDTWLWTGTDWSRLHPTHRPVARESFAMAYDEAIGRIVLAGGIDPQVSFYDDTWEFDGAGQFLDLGPGIAGASGVPTLLGTGDLTAGSSTGFQMSIGDAPPLSPAFVLIGLTPANVPFKGGTLYPFPFAAMVLLGTDSFGDAALTATIPSGTPSGTTIVFQTWFADPAAVHGMSATNGIEAIVP